MNVDAIFGSTGHVAWRQECTRAAKVQHAGQSRLILHELSAKSSVIPTGR